MSENGKGSTPRPFSVPIKEFGARYDAIDWGEPVENDEIFQPTEDRQLERPWSVVEYYSNAPYKNGDGRISGRIVKPTLWDRLLIKLSTWKCG